MIPTAEEFILKNTSLLTMAGNKQKVARAMIDFAKLHVEAALKAANERDKAFHRGQLEYDIDNIDAVILNAYPLENIK